MKKKIKHTSLFFMLVFCIAFVQNSFCQGNKLAKLDSLHQKFAKDSAYIHRVKKISPLFALDSRHSFIRNSTSKVAVDFQGFQLGVTLNQKHSMGIGFYSMLHVQETSPIVNEQKKVVKININIGYTTTFYQYAFTLGKRWAFGIPAEIGGGSYKITATDALGKRDTSFTDTLSRGILLFGTGLKVDFKVFKGVGLNLMGGVRIVGGNEPEKVNLNGVFYSFGLSFYVGDCIKWYKVGRKRRTYKKEVEKIISPDSFWDKK